MAKHSVVDEVEKSDSSDLYTELIKVFDGIVDESDIEESHTELFGLDEQVGLADSNSNISEKDRAALIAFGLNPEFFSTGFSELENENDYEFDWEDPSAFNQIGFALEEMFSDSAGHVLPKTFYDSVPQRIHINVAKASEVVQEQKKEPVVQEPELYVDPISLYRNLSELEKQRRTDASSWNIKTDGNTLIKEILDGGRINNSWLVKVYESEEATRVQLEKEYMLAEQLFENTYFHNNIGPYGTMMFLDYTSTLPKTEEAAKFAKETIDAVPDMVELIGLSNALDLTEDLCSLYHKNPEHANTALDNSIPLILVYGHERKEIAHGHGDLRNFIQDLHEL